MTPNLDELQRLASEATPGPWTSFYEGGGNHVISRIGHDSEVAQTSGSHALSGDESFERAAADARYIAAADPQTVLRLIAVAKAAERAERVMDQVATDMEATAQLFEWHPPVADVRDALRAALKDLE